MSDRKRKANGIPLVDLTQEPKKKKTPPPPTTSSSSSSSCPSYVYTVTTYMTGEGDWGEYGLPESINHQIQGVYATEELALEKAEELREEDDDEFRNEWEDGWQEDKSGYIWTISDNDEQTCYKNTDRVIEITKMKLEK